MKYKTAKKLLTREIKEREGSRGDYVRKGGSTYGGYKIVCKKMSITIGMQGKLQIVKNISPEGKTLSERIQEADEVEPLTRAASKKLSTEKAPGSDLITMESVKTA